MHAAYGQEPKQGEAERTSRMEMGTAALSGYVSSPASLLLLSCITILSLMFCLCVYITLPFVLLVVFYSYIAILTLSGSLCSVSLSFWLSFFLSLFLSVSLSSCLSFFLSLFLSVSFFLYLFLSVSFSFCLCFARDSRPVYVAIFYFCFFLHTFDFLSLARARTRSLFLSLKSSLVLTHHLLLYLPPVSAQDGSTAHDHGWHADCRVSLVTDDNPDCGREKGGRGQTQRVGDRIPRRDVAWLKFRDVS